MVKLVNSIITKSFHFIPISGLMRPRQVRLMRRPVSRSWLSSVRIWGRNCQCIHRQGRILSPDSHSSRPRILLHNLTSRTFRARPDGVFRPQPRRPLHPRLQPQRSLAGLRGRGPSDQRSCRWRRISLDRRWERRPRPSRFVHDGAASLGSASLAGPNDLSGGRQYSRPCAASGRKADHHRLEAALNK